MIESQSDKLNAEWTTLSAVRELMRLAMRDQRVTYAQALELGAVLVPELLDEDTSLIKQARESDTAREYRQLAEALSSIDNTRVEPLYLIRQDIEKYSRAFQIDKNNAGKDRIDRRLSLLRSAERELDPKKHSEHQLIFRDVYNVDYGLPEINLGQGYKDFGLPDGNILRVRVLHPDKPEHISGVDMIYERHYVKMKSVRIVTIQYKIWDRRSMYLSDDRIQKQIKRMKAFACDSGLCSAGSSDHEFRFPFCTAFLRPTDKLQAPDQKLRSTGEHLPICYIESCQSTSRYGAEVLKYDSIRDLSLPNNFFEELFSRQKIGSRSLSLNELQTIYKNLDITEQLDLVVLHAQEVVR